MGLKVKASPAPPWWSHCSWVLRIRTESGSLSRVGAEARSQRLSTPILPPLCYPTGSLDLLDATLKSWVSEPRLGGLWLGPPHPPPCSRGSLILRDATHEKVSVQVETVSATGALAQNRSLTVHRESTLAPVPRQLQAMPPAGLHRHGAGQHRGP